MRGRNIRARAPSESDVELTNCGMSNSTIDKASDYLQDGGQKDWHSWQNNYDQHVTITARVLVNGEPIPLLSVQEKADSERRESETEYKIFVGPHGGANTVAFWLDPTALPLGESMEYGAEITNIEEGNTI